jgi:uncharacterized membrane protein required for colicin V production
MTGFGGVTVYDGIMALIVFFTTVHGFWKGATWQIAPIMSLVLGYMVAMPMSVTTAQYFGSPPQNRLFAMVTIYIATSLVVYLMVRSFREGIEKAKLTEFDRHLGALLGALKGVLLTLSITVILLIYSTMARDIILKSESSTIAAKIINAVFPILPRAMNQLLRPYLRQLDGQLPLDLGDHGIESQLNSDILPERRSPLTPTNSSARRVFTDDDPVNTGGRPEHDLDQNDDYGRPAARPPHRPSTDRDSDPLTNSRRDSASRLDRRSSFDDHTDFTEPDLPQRRAYVPVPASDSGDPFIPANPDRYPPNRR